MPDARKIVFNRSNPNDEFFKGPSGVQERLRQLPASQDRSQFYLLLPDGSMVQFKRTVTVVGAYYDTEYRRWQGEQISSFKLLAIVDRSWRWTQFSYDSNGRLYRITDPSQRYLEVSWTTSGSNTAINQVKGWDGQWVKYEYSGVNITKAIYSDDTPSTEADNPRSTYAYQGSNVSGVSNALPLVCYDVRYPGAMRDIKYEFATGGGAVFGQIRAEKLPAGADTANLDVTVSTYDLSTHTETRGDGPSRQFAYSSYRLTSAKDFRGKATTFTYDANGYQNGITNPLGHRSTMTREPNAGQITQITHPDGRTVKYEYTNAAYPYYLSKVTDELGRLTSYTRDGNSRVTRIDYPATAQETAYETFTYNGFGQVLTHRLTNGYTESFTYDSYGQLTSSTDTDGKTTYYYYNAQGRMFWMTDPLNRSTGFSYNNRGQVTLIGQPDGTYVWFSYDVYGNLVAQGNELNQVWWWVYDRYNRTTYAYNPLGEWWYYGYRMTNSLANPFEIFSPLGRWNLRGYDENFALIQTTEAYEAGGAVTTYYAAGRQLTETQVIPGLSAKTVSHGYNADGVLNATGYPSGVALGFPLTPRGQTQGIQHNGGMLVSYSRDRNGRVVSRNAANNSFYSYDDAGRILVVRHERANGDMFSQIAYGYNAVNNRTYAWRETGLGDAYYYDANQQLTAVGYDAAKCQYFTGLANAHGEFQL